MAQSLTILLAALGWLAAEAPAAVEAPRDPAAPEIVAPEVAREQPAEPAVDAPPARHVDISPDAPSAARRFAECLLIDAGVAGRLIEQAARRGRTPGTSLAPDAEAEVRSLAFRLGAEVPLMVDALSADLEAAFAEAELQDIAGFFATEAGLAFLRALIAMAPPGSPPPSTPTILGLVGKMPQDARNAVIGFAISRSGQAYRAKFPALQPRLEARMIAALDDRIAAITPASDR